MKKRLQIGDKVKLSKLGYHFHHNITEKIQSHSTPGKGLLDESMEEMFCEVLSIQGTGTVVKFNSSGDPYIKWDYRNADMYFFSGFYYGKEELRRLTLWEKVCSYFA